MCQTAMSSERRPDAPATKASSKNVALAAGSVSAGTRGSSLFANKRSFQFSDHTISRQGGFYDVWGIRFNAAEGKVAGDRFRVTNFASSSLMIPNNMGDVALSISRDKLALSMSQVSGSMWVLNDVDQ